MLEKPVFRRFFRSPFSRSAKVLSCISDLSQFPFTNFLHSVHNSVTD
nr:MAG TPA: hypothetical protein [Caudoviricetes sp.]